MLDNADFRTLADALPQIVWVADAAGRTEFFNRKWTEYTGAPYEPSTAAVVAAAFVHPDDAAATMMAFQEAGRTGTTFVVEHRIRAHDGSYRWFLVRAEPGRDASGRVVRWFGSSTDIHDARVAAARLRTREEQHAFLLRLSDLLRPLADPLAIQGEAARLLGEHLDASRVHYAEIENDTYSVVARDYARGAPDRAGRYKLDDYPAVIADCRAGRTVVVDSVPDDERFTADERAAFAVLPLAAIILVPLVKDTRFVAMLAVHSSTPRAWTADEITLIEETAERTWAAVERAYTEVENARLYRELQETSRRKDDFLALLGHELRNPLAPIVTAVDLMKLRGDTDVRREREIIAKQARHLIRLVEDLLDVSRIARGKVELVREPIALATLVANSVEMTKPLFDERRHRLTVDVAADLVVDVDRARMEQVISNLLTNAAKYTPPEGDIAVRGRTSEAGQVSLVVADNGIGIAAEVLPHVFEMFIQERQALDRTRGGLGLGLSIVKSLVEQHDGVVVARSAGPGQGAEVEVVLPAATSVHAGAPSPAAPSAVPSRRSLRILVVDDNQDAATMLADVASALGHTTRIAADGVGALQIATEFGPQVVLLDIGLPGMNGWELGARLRQLIAHPLRLVAVSGYGQPADRERSVAAGLDAHLVKPIDLDALARLLEELTR